MYCNFPPKIELSLEPRAFLTWRAPGTILELFWVPLGVSWGLFRHLGSSLATLGGHFGLPLWDLGVPRAPSGCILATFFVALASNIGPKGHFLHDVGSCGVIVQDFCRNCVRFSLASLGVLCFTVSLLFMVSPLFVFLVACSLCLRRSA